MHPTGVPGLLPFFHIAQVLPLGSLGFRMSLVSCVFASALVAGVAQLLLAWRVPRWLVGMCFVWLCLGQTLVRNARVVEIYSFGGLLTLLVLALLVGVRRIE